MHTRHPVEPALFCLEFSDDDPHCLMSAAMCRRLDVVAGRRYTLCSGILGWGAGAPSPVTCPTRSGVCSQEVRMKWVRHHTLSNRKIQQAVCSA